MTRHEEELDRLFLHDCEDCQHATLAARTALRADPFASVAIGLIRLDEG